MVGDGVEGMGVGTGVVGVGGGAVRGVEEGWEVVRGAMVEKGVTVGVVGVMAGVGALSLEQMSRLG